MDCIFDMNNSLNASFVEQILETQPSPISTLPNELLLEVFHILTFDVKASNVVPATLSHVSQLWRDLVLHTSGLWTKVLVVEDLGPGITEFRKTIHRVQFFLAHSAARALDLHIELRTYHNDYVMGDPDHPFHTTVDQFRECTRSISSSLVPHLWRIKSFNLECDEFKSVCDIQSGLPFVPMTMLEDLRVHQAYEEQNFENFSEDTIEMAGISIPLGPRFMEEEMYPKLRSAVMTAIPIDWQCFCPKRLHTLEISFLPMQARPDGETLRQILLANEPSLKSLTLHGAGPVDDAPTPYVMSNLRHLDLGYAYPSELINFVKCLRVPSLVTLGIRDLRRIVTFATERRNLHYDHSTSTLFQAIVDEFPLHQVKQLELRHVSFMPEYGLLPLYPEVQIIPNRALLPIPVTSLRFLCKLTALKSLTIVNPDPGTLHALNYLPPPIKARRTCDDSQFTHVPVPALDFLHLADFNLPLVSLFLAIRCSHLTSFRRLFLLMLSMPATWLVDFDSLLLLADDIQLFDTILDPIVEEDLMIPYQ